MEGWIAQGRIGRAIDHDEQDEQGEGGQNKPAHIAAGHRP